VGNNAQAIVRNPPIRESSLAGAICASPGFDVANIQVLPESIGTPVPEPTTWAMMLFEFGAIGLTMRRRRRVRLALVT